MLLGGNIVTSAKQRQMLRFPVYSCSNTSFMQIARCRLRICICPHSGGEACDHPSSQLCTAAGHDCCHRLSCQNAKSLPFRLQDNWDQVLCLATHVSRPSETGSPARDPGHPGHAAVRRAALLLMEAVLHGGHVAPWTSISTLMTLTTDPNRCSLVGPCLLLNACYAKPE